MKRWLPILFLASVSAADNASQYHVKEQGRNLELTTPDGNRIFYGNADFDMSRDYKIKIPLKSLQKPVEEDKRNPGASPQVQILPVQIPGQKDRLPAENGPVAADGSAAPNSTGGGAIRPTDEYDDTARLVVEANHLYNRGKFYEATVYVEELIRKKPGYTRGWIMKGSLMYVQNQKDLAKTAWEHALSLEPENREIRDLLARYR